MTSPKASSAAALSSVEPGVAAVLRRLPLRQRARLKELRSLILKTAAATAGVGPLTETLKWNEPAYLPKAPRVGTTIRMNAVKSSTDDVALYFHCQTRLVSTFRELYPEIFRFEGNRALILDARKPLAEEPLAHCIALALTYHLKSGAREATR